MYKQAAGGYTRRGETKRRDESRQHHRDHSTAAASSLFSLRWISWQKAVWGDLEKINVDLENYYLLCDLCWKNVNNSKQNSKTGLTLGLASCFFRGKKKSSSHPHFCSLELYGMVSRISQSCSSSNYLHGTGICL